jgi:hypothetical protein
MINRFLLFTLFVLFFTMSFVLNENLVTAQMSGQPKLSVSFENNAASSYTESLPTNEKYVLSQDYSWIRDDTSRYNLISFSIDGGESIPISRTARGTFTLDIPTDSSHSVVFSTATQFPLTVIGTDEYSFMPSSPTSDNWFDVNSEVSVTVPKSRTVEKNKVRQEITGWSLDGTESWNIPKDNTNFFISPPITMNDFHLVDFSSTTQFKLTVLSENGETQESSWYADGEIVPITISSSNDGLVLYTLSELDGYDGEISGNSIEVIVNGPITITAKFEKNYGLLASVIIIPILIAGVFVGKKVKSSKFKFGTGASVEDIAQTVEKVIETKLVENSPKSKYVENYDEQITSYLSAQVSEKLDSLHDSKIISDLKYEKVKNLL